MARLLDTLRRLRGGTPPQPRLPDRSTQGVSPRDHERLVLSHVEEGDPDAALEAAIEATDAFPQSTDLWFLRFNLLLVSEALDEAADALRRIAAMDPLQAPGANVCLELVAAEVHRRAVLSGAREPDLRGGVAPELQLQLECVSALARGDRAAAEAAAMAARAAGPEIRGTIDDVSYQGLRDVDDRYGQVLELLVPDRCVWVPYRALAWVEFLPLRTWLDFAWMPVHLELRDGSELRAHLPGLYTGSAAAEGRVRLGQETAFVALGPGLAQAMGGRQLQTARRVVPLRHVRVLNVEG